jgi:ERCC4-type nuclease
VLVIDDREPLELLRALQPLDITFTTARLDFGDCMFEGAGPRGPVLVGWERKHLSDLINAMQDGRLSGHQLRGMWSYYDYCYLVIEDRWRPGPNGEIQTLSGRTRGWTPLYTGSRHGITYRQVDAYIASLELRGNVIVCRTESAAETAALYVSRFQSWQKPWDQHHSHDQIYCNDLSSSPARGKARIMTREAGLIEKIAAQLPGIDRKAWDVGKHFPSVQSMLMASEKDWQSIPGIGKIIAKQVVEALRKTKAAC